MFSMQTANRFCAVCFLYLFLSTALAFCSKAPVTNPTLSSEKKISYFGIRMYNNLGLYDDANGIITNDTIRFSLADGYPLFYLFPSISFSGKHIAPSESLAQNFSNPVVYTVTAEDGTTKNYIVLGKSILNSSSKDILAFNFKAANNPFITTDTKGVILHDSVLVQLPFGTDVSRLVPFILINGVSVSPDNLSPQNFSQPMLYKVTAEDGSSKEYLVIVKN